MFVPISPETFRTSLISGTVENETPMKKSKSSVREDREDVEFQDRKRVLRRMFWFVLDARFLGGQYELEGRSPNSGLP